MLKLPTLLLISCLAAVSQPPTAEQFLTRATRALPREESYSFIEQHASGLPDPPRDSAADAGANEFEIPRRGWSLQTPASASEPLRVAAEELRQYLGKTMAVELTSQTAGLLSNWAAASKMIVAGSRGQLGNCGAGLRNSKDYQLLISPERIVVCGFDDLGAMHGLYDLWRRISLREAPILPRTLDVSRHSKHRTRMVLSGLGWMEWPDRYLATLPRYGFDALFCSIYRNPNNAPGVGPYWDQMKEHKPGAMKDLVRRAARYGVGVYTPILYHYTGTPENIAGLKKLVRDIVTEFPEIRGYVLLTEGFYYKKWFGAGGHGEEDLKRWVAEWSRAVGIASAEIHRINPKIEVLPWEYNVAFAPDFARLKAYVMTQLPADSIPLLTFENGKAYELDGHKGWLRDYAINQVGPAEVTMAQLEEARRRPQPFQAIYSKADTFASWQFGTFPYLPFPYQWHARYEQLDQWKVNGTLESWSYGFKPNWVAEMRAWYAWTGAPPLDTLLRQIARREFGGAAVDGVLKAWKSFSDAIQVYPDTGPNWGSCNALASPLFFEKPKPRAMTLDHSWSDPTLWSRDSQLNPYWPYVPSRLIFWPDFTNEKDNVERYVRFFPVPVFQQYLKLAADRMEEGLKAYRAAALSAPETKRKSAYREVLLAEQIQHMMRSEWSIIEFEERRLALAKSQDRAAKTRLLSEMEALLRDERKRTAAAKEIAERDSRLGYEWEQDYIYTPDTIEEKLKLIDVTLGSQIPAYRAKLR